MFLNGMVGIVRISDCEWRREGVSAWWQRRRWPKAEFLWVLPSLPPVSVCLCKVCLW